MVARFDEKTKQEIAHKWLYEGIKSSVLVKEYGFTNQRAFRVYMNKNGYVKRDVQKRLTPEEIVEVKGLYIAGWTMQDIADYLKITKQGVSALLKRYGFTYKDRPREIRLREKNG